MPADLRFRLLGVPVELESSDDDVRGRLRLVYGALADGEDVGRPVRASVRSIGDAFEVAVEGRETDSAPDRTQAVRLLNHELMHALMLRERSCFYVHAAVVASGGGGIVLPGLSCSGKSTLALALVMAGARLLSDELMVFDPATRLLRSFPRALKIRDTCAGYFPGLSDAFEGSGEGRFLALERLGPDVVADAVPIGGIVAPAWDAAGGNRPQPLSSGQGLLRLCASALNFGTHRALSLDHLAALTCGARCFDIRWSDPHRAAGAILEALAS